MSLMRSRTWSASMRRILELNLELVKHMSFHCAPQISKFINRLYSRVDLGNQMKGDEVIAVTCSTHGLRCRIFGAMMVLSLSSPTCPRLVRHPRPRARGEALFVGPGWQLARNSVPERCFLLKHRVPRRERFSVQPHMCTDAEMHSNDRYIV